MKNLPWRWIFPLLATMSALCAWAAVIWVALQVSTIVLKTLDQIVQLAQLG